VILAVERLQLASNAMPIAGIEPGYLWLGALLVLLAGALRAARRTGLDERTMYWTVICAFGGGLLGGRVAVLAMHGIPSGINFFTAIASGDRSSFGAFLGGAAAAALCLRARGAAAARYADAAVPALFIAYAVGRFGCLFNGDDFGSLSSLPWAIRYPASTLAYQDQVARGWIPADAAWSLPMHPWPLYSALGAVLLYYVLRRAGSLPGERAALAVVGYGALRALLELLRGDARAMLGPLPVPEWCAITAAAVGVALWWWIRYAPPRTSHAITAPSAP
jgi:phosphatidylglycerol:prolipoprotein diacylglycerol transferase